MSRATVFEKVSSFVTRTGRNGAELLVFEHPSAGIQVPAGSVEEGEAPVAAAQREVREETGLSAEGALELASLSTDLGGARILLQTEQLGSAASVEAPMLEERVRRGLTVHLTATDGVFSLVLYEEYDLNKTPRELVRRVEGWVPSSSLGVRVVRYFFHLRFTGDTPTRWQVAADNHVFRPFWAALSPRPRLAGIQNDWLDHVYERLLERSAGQ